MNTALELHDSYLKEWGCDEDGRGFALFHAVIHRAKGEVFGGSGHESGWQDLRFDFEEMRIEGSVDFTEDTYLSEGSLWINGEKEGNIIYLPADHDGELCLEMRIAPAFGVSKIHAKRMRSRLVGAFEHECFWDANGPLSS